MSQDIEELSPCISAVDDSISGVHSALEPLFNCSISDIASQVSPLQRAKLDVISLYAANSLFWVYLKTQGINPTEHGLSQELERVKTYIKRLKEIEDKKFAPKLNQAASKRVMRNALWSAAHKGKTPVTQGETQSTAQQNTTDHSQHTSESDVRKRKENNTQKVGKTKKRKS